MITGALLLGHAAKQNIAPGLEMRRVTMAWRFAGLSQGEWIRL